LLAAIEKLKETPDIEEPTEEARRNDIHLDSDRQGLSGSPDLARAILNKIDVSAVFVGDVTPVGRGPQGKAGDTAEGRPLMNPNAAIELGYALASLTDARVLMVLNTAYGDRDGLPFDIRHKAGPIIYHLAEGSSAKDIAAEKARLTASLVEALEPFIVTESRSTPTFSETQPTIGKAFYFKDGEVLARGRHAADEYVLPYRRVVYLRVMPSAPLPRPLSLDLLINKSIRFGKFGQNSGWDRQENDYGVIVFSPAGNTSNIDSLTQFFRNGEIWGINAELFRQHQMNNIPVANSYSLEATIAESLQLYCDFLKDVSEAALPYTVEMGMQGVRGMILAINKVALNKNMKIADDRFEMRHTLNATDLSTREKLLLDFFNMVFDQTGRSRPEKLYGFPPDRK
jgi:hypothetical protein